MRRLIAIGCALAAILLAAETFGPVNPPSQTDDGYIEAFSVGHFPTTAEPGGLTMVTNFVPRMHVSIQSGFAYYYDMALFRFDTSSLPDNAIISAATLTLHHNNQRVNISGCQFGLGWYSGAWSTAAFASYDTPQTSAYGPAAVSTLPQADAAWNQSLSNPTNVNRTGWTQFRMHMWSCPVSTVGQSSTYEFYDTGTAGKKPALTVTYTAGGGPQLILTVYQE